MKTHFSGNTLTIQLDERIDTANAAGVEKDLSAAVEEYHPQHLILDTERLQYISSVGLRVLLKLKKAVDSTEIVNTSLEVYDIFEMTGFTDILSVKKALRTISVEGCEIIGRGGHGTVYRLDGDTIVKLYNENEPLEEIEREISYSKKSFIYGIPTAISFDIVKCGSQYGVVFELLNADTLTNTFLSAGDKFDEYAEKYCRLVKNLHETEADTSVFFDIKTLYHQWADDMTEYYTDEQVALLHEIISGVPDRKTFVHGDIHPKNIMVQDGELLFIDMADMSYGHPIWDYAGIALTHVISRDYSQYVLGLSSETAQKLFDRMIESNFADRTPEERAHIRQLILMFAMLKFALAPAVNKGENPKMRDAVAQAARERFFPTAKQLIGAVDF